MRKLTRWAMGPFALALVAAACTPNATQDSLEPAGPYADKIDNLFTPVFWVAAAIFFLVEGTLVWFLIKYRHRRGRTDIPPQVHGNTRLEIAWTILPALILAGVAVPTVTTIFDLSRRPEASTIDVNVLGHQWWWEFDYPDLDVNTANELHIPVGTPVYLTLCAVGSGYQGQPVPNECQADLPLPATLGGAVIHSFWVPELAGKQDVVPARANTMVIQADRPGTYTGQCAEYCGLSHAYMRFRVIAQPPEEFDAWVREQQADAAAAPDGLAAQGQGLFTQTCISCHAVNGLKDAEGQPVAGGIQAPNLTHLMSRDCFAGCILETSTENLTKWVSDAPSLKPGSLMPSGLKTLNLTPEQIRAVVAYLETLR